MKSVSQIGCILGSKNLRAKEAHSRLRYEVVKANARCLGVKPS